MMCKYTDCANEFFLKRRWLLKGLVVCTGIGPVAKDLADVAVGPLFALVAVVGSVWRRVWHLHLCGTVLGVVEVEAVTDVAEQSWWSLLLYGLLKAAQRTKKSDQK